MTFVPARGGRSWFVVGEVFTLDSLAAAEAVSAERGTLAVLRRVQL